MKKIQFMQSKFGKKQKILQKLFSSFFPKRRPNQLDRPNQLRPDQLNTPVSSMSLEKIILKPLSFDFGPSSNRISIFRQLAERNNTVRQHELWTRYLTLTMKSINIWIRKLCAQLKDSQNRDNQFHRRFCSLLAVGVILSTRFII